MSSILINNNYFYKVLLNNTIDYNLLEDIINDIDNNLLIELFNYDIQNINIKAHLFDNIHICLLISYVYNNNIPIETINIYVDDTENINFKYINYLYNLTKTNFNLTFFYPHLWLSQNEFFVDFISNCKINEINIYGNDCELKNNNKICVNVDIINKLIKENNVKVLNYYIEYDDYDLNNLLHNNTSLENIFILKRQNCGLLKDIQNIPSLKKVNIYHNEYDNLSEFIYDNHSLEYLIIYNSNKYMQYYIPSKFFEELKNNKTIKSLETVNFSNYDINSLSEILPINNTLKNLILSDCIDNTSIFIALINNSFITYLNTYINDNNVDSFINLLNNNIWNRLVSIIVH